MEVGMLHYVFQNYVIYFLMLAPGGWISHASRQAKSISGVLCPPLPSLLVWTGQHRCRLQVWQQQGMLHPAGVLFCHSPSPCNQGHSVRLCQSFHKGLRGRIKNVYLETLTVKERKIHTYMTIILQVYIKNRLF